MVSWTRNDILDWRTFIAEVLKAIAWPAFLFFTVLVFRKPLLDLIPALRRLRFKEFELEFGRELLEAERWVTALPVRPEVVRGAGTAPERLRHIATVAPTAAILEAWRDLEAAAADAAARRGFSVAGGIWQLFAVLQSERILTEAQASAVDSLRRLRNKVAHTDDGGITEEQALRYVEIAASLAATIRGAS